MRVLAAGAAAVALCGVLLVQRDTVLMGRTALGPWLFAWLHTALSVVLAVTCPLMSADTLARERREGTLGILLLTPLKPKDIALGKMAVHLLRAFTMWLATLPVLIVPLMLGGVGPVDIGFALALESGVVQGALSGGMLASNISQDAGRAAALQSY